MPLLIYILDLLGTFSFAVFGSYLALKKDFDLFGIFVAAFLSALGGGTIREVIMNHVPFYFFDMHYIVVIFAAVIFTLFIYNTFSKLKFFALLLDSVGLVTFAFIGAAKASEAGLALFAIVFFATVTAVGGGILRDLVLNEVPKIMYYDFYASVAILLGLLYGLAGDLMQHFFWVYLLMGICLIIRLAVIAYNIHLWRPRKFLYIK